MSGRSNRSEARVAERIAQLSEIDRDVAKLLQSAGTALKTLTVPALESDEGQGDKAQDIEQRKQDFTASSSQYFSLLSSIDVRLRRQIAALEEAEIIPSEMTAKESQASTDISNSVAKISPPSKNTITNGGLGTLDVGWLNSRNDNIGTMMEAELWEKAQKLVQNRLANEEVKDGNDVTMNTYPTRSLG
ncbi:MAG: hypothetical protein Q9225_002162 [Loekoesia sp. 1 TL-2023]